jgi:hypothetical protein
MGNHGSALGTLVGIMWLTHTKINLHIQYRPNSSLEIVEYYDLLESEAC